MVFVREDIPSRMLPTIKGFEDFEGLFIEINLRKSKWLLLATYKPPSLSKEFYFSQVNKALDAFGSNFENIILMGDLNTTDTDETLIEFLEDREFSNLVHFPTCFMSEENPSTMVSRQFLTRQFLTMTVSHGKFLSRQFLTRQFITRQFLTRQLPTRTLSHSDSISPDNFSLDSFPHGHYLTKTISHTTESHPIDNFSPDIFPLK